MRLFQIVSLLFLTLLFQARAQESPNRPAPARTSKPIRELPGAQAGGSILLHNQWSLRPAGKQVELGDFPVNTALHPSGQWLAVLHAGYGEHEIAIVDLNRRRQKICCRVILDQTFYGLCFSPDGKQLFASGGEYEVVHVFDFAGGLLSGRRQVAVANDGTAGLASSSVALRPRRTRRSNCRNSPGTLRRMVA